MIRRCIVLLLVSAAACAKRESPATASADSTHAPAGPGRVTLVTRFVGTWVRPSPVRPGRLESMTLGAEGALTLGNVCGEHGVTWAGVPGDSVSLTSQSDSSPTPHEVRYHVRALTDSMLVLKGDDYLGGRWIHGAAPVTTSCGSK